MTAGKDGLKRLKEKKEKKPETATIEQQNT